jgi:hypothetical protein
MFLILLALGCDDIGQSCNMMYAPSTVDVTINGLSEGAWEWTIDVGDHGVVCTATLPDASDAACEGNAWSGPSVTQAADGSWSAQVMVELGEAGTVAVSATKDGAVVLDGDHEVEWTVDEPNGEGCGERSVGALEVAIEG